MAKLNINKVSKDEIKEILTRKKIELELRDEKEVIRQAED